MRFDCIIGIATILSFEVKQAECTVGRISRRQYFRNVKGDGFHPLLWLFITILQKLTQAWNSTVAEFLYAGESWLNIDKYW